MRLIPDILHAAGEARLPFVVIGGLAVSAYGSPRLTLDVDLMIPGPDLPKWEALLRGFAFEKFAEHPAFAQFRCPLADVWPLDLMLVAEATFAKIMAEGEDSVLGGHPVRLAALREAVPDLELPDCRGFSSQRTPVSVDEVIRASELQLARFWSDPEWVRRRDAQRIDVPFEM